MMSAGWSNKTPLIASPSQQQQFDIHPWTKGLCRTMESSPICQGPWGECQTLMYQVTGTQTLVLTADPAVTCNLHPLSQGPGALKNPVLANHPHTREPLRKSRVQQRSSAYCWRKNKTSLGALERGTRTVSLHQCHPSF